MRLAFSAWAMPRRPLAEQVGIVREAGYSAIELVSTAGGPLDAVAASAELRAEVKRLLDSAELELTSVAGHADPIASDPAERATNLARIRAGLDLVAELPGRPCLVCMGYGKPERYLEQRQQLADTFGELARHASSRGVVLALEPHVGQAIDLPEKVAWLVAAVGSPAFQLNFDNSHFECLGRSIESYVPLLVPYSVHTHLKDQAGIWPEHQFLVPGEGSFNYPRYLRAMAAAGYRGAITVEISVMIQRRLDYDPWAVARRCHEVMSHAARAAGVHLT